MTAYEIIKAHRNKLRSLEAAPITSLDDVRARLVLIAVVGPHDDEAGHAAEDILHQDVLRAIAVAGLSGEFCAELAALALTTRDIKFARWCS